MCKIAHIKIMDRAVIPGEILIRYLLTSDRQEIPTQLHGVITQRGPRNDLDQACRGLGLLRLRVGVHAFRGARWQH